MARVKRGFFVVFEGGEACGKSTQIQWLARALKKQGREVVLTREPGGSPLGEKLRSLFKEHAMSALTEVFLLEAARSDHVSQVIAPALKRGAVVISDRFAASTLVYQGFTRGLKIDLIRNLNKIAVQNIRPDRTYLLDTSEGWKRLNARGHLDRLEREGAEFHQKIRKNYLKILKMDRSAMKIDANQSIEDIHSVILKDLEKYLLKPKKKR